MQNIKKTDIFLIAAVFIIVIIGIVFMGKNKTVNIDYDLPLTLEGESKLTELTYSEYKEKVDSEKPFIFIVERTTCSHCQNYMPVAESFAEEYNVPIYYIDTDTLSEDEFNSLQKSNSFFKKNSGNWGTPTTIILVGNQAVDYLEGEADSNGLYDFLDDYITIENN